MGEIWVWIQIEWEGKLIGKWKWKKKGAEINEKIRRPYLERVNMSSSTPVRVEIRLPVDKNHFEGGRAGSWWGSHLLLYLFWGNSIITCMQIKIVVPLIKLTF